MRLSSTASAAVVVTAAPFRSSPRTRGPSLDNGLLDSRLRGNDRRFPVLGVVLAAAALAGFFFILAPLRAWSVQIGGTLSRLGWPAGRLLTRRRGQVLLRPNWLWRPAWPPFSP